MKKRLCFPVIILLFFIPVFLFPQTAAQMEELLGTPVLRYEQAVRFVLRAADLTGEVSAEEAFRQAKENKFLPRQAETGTIASLEGVSLLIMRSFDIKGGLFYTIFKNPHYAYKELMYKGIIQDRSDPAMAVSGEHLIFLVNRILSVRGGEGEQDFDIDRHISRTAEEEQVRQEAERRERERTVRREALAAEIKTQLEAHALEDTSASITEQGVTISLSNIQFLANSSELPDAEKLKLQEIAEILNVIPQRRILVTGHTALAGTAQDQLKTSQDRAASVAAYLVFLEVRNADEVFAQGFGSERPIADNSTPEGMALNRRVEIIILEDQ